MDFEAIDNLKTEIENLKKELKQKEDALSLLLNSSKHQEEDKYKLSNEDIARFSRQIIMSEIGVSGQIKLKNSSVLIVGMGGLGCPAAQYLIGAGIGTLGLVDYDEVEINNLHRQLLHNEKSIGQTKTQSAKDALLRLNSKANIHTYYQQFNSENAISIIEKYDIVVDATDNVATRYLLNDACVMSNRPLVSGSALQFEGQLTVYNYQNGPCYRCIFPKPPPPETVTNCGDGGVIGAITGCIGTLQALETIKILLQLDGVLAGRLLMFDGSETNFRTVKLRPKRLNCDVCSDTPTLTKLIDYEQFCGMKASDKDLKLNILNDNDRCTVLELNEIVTKKMPHLLIDVRSTNEYEICHIDSSLNIPLNSLEKNLINDKELSRKIQSEPVYFLCRRGNDSQIAVKKCHQIFENVSAKDIIGGLHEWTRMVDPNFPKY